jgi:hypothetical protein
VRSNIFDVAKPVSRFVNGVGKRAVVVVLLSIASSIAPVGPGAWASDGFMKAMVPLLKK